VALLNIFIFTAVVFIGVGATSAILWSSSHHCRHKPTTVLILWGNHGFSLHITTQTTLEQVVANIYQLNFSLMYKFLECNSSWISLPFFEICNLILLHFYYLALFLQQIIGKIKVGFNISLS
jgi:hypothetical protein